MDRFDTAQVSHYFEVTENIIDQGLPVCVLTLSPPIVRNIIL